MRLVKSFPTDATFLDHRFLNVKRNANSVSQNFNSIRRVHFFKTLAAPPCVRGHGRAHTHTHTHTHLYIYICMYTYHHHQIAMIVRSSLSVCLFLSLHPSLYPSLLAGLTNYMQCLYLAEVNKSFLAPLCVEVCSMNAYIYIYIYKQTYTYKNRQNTYKIRLIRLETQWKIGNLG